MDIKRIISDLDNQDIDALVYLAVRHSDTVSTDAAIVIAAMHNKWKECEKDYEKERDAHEDYERSWEDTDKLLVETLDFIDTWLKKKNPVGKKTDLRIFEKEMREKRNTI